MDLPGCYSLLAHSEEEMAARDFICFGQPDAVVAVCDATCLERNMNLVLQILETAENVVVCVNLMDEAVKKGIGVDLEKLETELGVPVIGTTARSRKGLEGIFRGLDRVLERGRKERHVVDFPAQIEEAVRALEPMVEEKLAGRGNTRWICAKLLDADEELLGLFRRHLGISFEERKDNLLWKARRNLEEAGFGKEQVNDAVIASFIHRAEEIYREAVTLENQIYDRKDRFLDKIFTSRLSGFPIMFLMLMGVFWITLSGANIPSQILSKWLFGLEGYLLELVKWAGMPQVIYNPFIFGIYRVLAWVISVMLPPMAIFFPLFQLLEDFGYLPRVAFNLDRCFKKCCACGKQALTMCMVCFNLLGF